MCHDKFTPKSRLYSFIENFFVSFEYWLVCAKASFDQSFCHCKFNGSYLGKFFVCFDAFIVPIGIDIRIKNFFSSSGILSYHTF